MVYTHKVCSYISTISALLMIVLSKENPKRELDLIRGTYHAWWIITGTPIDIVQNIIDESLLSGKIKLMPQTWPAWNHNYTHPMIFELGYEYDCGPIAPSWLRSNFNEFKFEIPFVTSEKHNRKPLNFKYILYEDSTVESISSRLFYGLDARKGTFHANNTIYDISFDGKSLNASASATDTWKNVSSSPLFKIYEEAMKLPWFGIKGPTECARHYYDFANAIYRPAMGYLQIDPDILGPAYSSPTMPFFGLTEAWQWGAVEVRVNFTMSLPKDCSLI